MVRLSVQIGDESFVQTDFQIKDFSDPCNAEHYLL